MRPAAVSWNNRRTGLAGPNNHFSHPGSFMQTRAGFEGSVGNTPLIRIESLSAKEIGERMGRSENAVHLLLSRALKRLAQELNL